MVRLKNLVLSNLVITKTYIENILINKNEKNKKLKCFLENKNVIFPLKETT